MTQFSSHIYEPDFAAASHLTSADRLQKKLLRTCVKLVPETPGVMVLELYFPGKFPEDGDQVIAFPLLSPMAKQLSDQLSDAVATYLNSLSQIDVDCSDPEVIKELRAIREALNPNRWAWNVPRGSGV